MHQRVGTSRDNEFRSHSLPVPTVILSTYYGSGGIIGPLYGDVDALKFLVARVLRVGELRGVGGGWWGHGCWYDGSQ